MLSFASSYEFTMKTSTEPWMFAKKFSEKNEAFPSANFLSRPIHGSKILKKKLNEI